MSGLSCKSRYIFVGMMRDRGDVYAVFDCVSTKFRGIEGDGFLKEHLYAEPPVRR